MKDHALLIVTDMWVRWRTMALIVVVMMSFWVAVPGSVLFPFPIRLLLWLAVGVVCFCFYMATSSSQKRVLTAQQGQFLVDHASPEFREALRREPLVVTTYIMWIRYGVFRSDRLDELKKARSEELSKIFKGEE